MAPSIQVPDDIWGSFQSDQLAQRSQAMLDGLTSKLTDALTPPAPSAATLAPSTGLPSLDALMSPFAPAARSLGAAAVRGLTAPDDSSPSPDDSSPPYTPTASAPASSGLPSFQALPSLGSLVASAMPSMSSAPPTPGEPGGPPLRHDYAPLPLSGQQAPVAAPLTIDHSSPQAFLGGLSTAATAALQRHNLPTSLAPILAAIPMNEQGWQKDAPGNNYYGIKGSNPRTGANTGPVGTWEDYGQGRQNIQDTFRAYDDPSQSVDDFLSFLESNPRYSKALDVARQTGDAAGFIRAVHAAGYATDPAWSDKILSISKTVPQTPAARQPALTTGPTPTAAQPSSGALDADGIVKAYADTSYTYGGPGGRTAGFGAPSDCSGFVSAIYQHQYGLDLVPHTDGAYNQLKQLGAPEVKTADARPGDVVFYMGAGTGGAITHHMGVYAGDGKVLDDSVSGQDGVHVRDVGHAGQYVILRDPRLNAQTPASASAPPPIQPSGLAEQTGGARVNQQQLAQAATSQPGGPPWAATAPSAQAVPSQTSAPPDQPPTSTDSASADQGLMLRQPFGQVPTSMTTLDQSQAPTFQDDQTQSGYVTPDMTPGPPVPDMTGTAAQAPDTSGPDLGPALPPQPSFPQRVVDTASSIPGAIQSGLSAAGSALQGANTAASNAVNAVTGGISQASSELGSALTAAGLPNVPAIVGAVGSQVVGPEAGIVGVSKAVQRSQQIDQQAADWLLQQGRISPQRATGALGSANDPAWRAANPDLAAEYDDLQSQITMTVGGMVGAGGEHPAPEGAPRPGEPAAAAPRPETSIAPDMTAHAPDTTAAPAPAPQDIPAPTAVENAHAALDTLEAQGVDVAQARSALPERPGGSRSAAPDVAPTAPSAAPDAAAPSAAPDATPSSPPVPPAADTPGRIPGMGYYDPSGTSPEAADLVRQERGRYEQNDLRTVPRAEVVAQAGRILEQDPETVARWQREVAASDRATPVVKGQVLQESAYGDAHAAVEATQRFNDAQAELKAHIESGGKAEDAPPELKQRLAEATTDLADLKAQLQTSATAHTAYGTAAARIMNQRKSAVSARSAFQLAQQGKQLAQEARAAAEAARQAAEKGAVDSGTAGKLRAARDRLAESVSEKGQARAAQVEDRLAGVEQQAEQSRQRARSGRGAQTQRPPRPAAERPPPVSETLEERLGRLKREHGAAEDAGDTEATTSKQADIDATLSEMRARAAEEAQKMLNRTQKPLTPEQAQQAVDRAIGRRASSRINKEARDAASGRAQGEFLSKFDQSLGKKIDAAIAKDRKLQAQAQVGDLAKTARDWHQRSLSDPANEAFRREEQAALQNLEQHSTVGKATADDLRQRFEANRSEAAFRHVGDVEQRNADAARREQAATAREVEASRIRGVVSQIDQVLANPHAPGMAERLQQLHADLAEVSQKGFEKSSDLRKRLNERNLINAGMAKGSDLDSLVKALAKVDPNDPASIRPVLAAIQRPTTMGVVREMQYINMLSSPITHAVNASSNAMQIAGRLLVNNPLEFIGSGGTSSGTGAAFEGAAHGLSRGAELAKTVMKTGVNPDAVERAIETGSVGNVNRELLTEKFGKLGEAFHAVSTRPLEAMDAMLGHVVYSSVVEQEAQKLADHMLSQGAAEVKGMTRQTAADYIKAHIWDYPEIIQKAGKIQDYTLLKSHDVGQGFGGQMEAGLRRLVGTRYGGNPFVSAAFDIALPFFNVPLNFTKQGLSRTGGALYNSAKFGGDVRAAMQAGTPAERLAARTSAGENFAKAGISAGILTTAIGLSMGDNLTGDGPTDPAKRAIWAENHQPHSVRLPGTNQWISYDGTPLAVPFAAVAGAADEYADSTSAPGNQTLSPSDALVKRGLGAFKGTAKGVASQSFLQGIQDQYATLTGPTEQNVSRSIAGTASRAVPLGGMVSWLARMTDGIQRDTGRAQLLSDMPANVGAQLASRIPGLREQLSPRLGAYGEDTANPQSGIAGALPYYRGPGQNPNDPLTQHLEASNVGTVLPPRSMPISLGPGTNQSVDIPLTQDEQRAYQQIAGQEFRRLLEQNPNAQTMSQAGLVQIRGAARQIAEARVQQQIGADEIRKRLQPGLGALQQKAG